MRQSFKNIYHLIIAFLVNIWFGFPSKNLTVIGVTGTDGKTTTTSLIYHILNTTNEKVAMITTIGVFTKEKSYNTGLHTTTPSSFYLQKYIKMIKDKGYKYLILEVTSHAIDQNRVFGIPFEIGVLTNITHEHLDYHKTYEDYALSKFKLLKMAKMAIVNMDDESYKYSTKFKVQSSKCKTYGMGKSADVNFSNFQFRTKLLGEFNKYNILAAVAVCKKLGVSDNDIKKAIETFESPTGRQEIVYDRDFKIIIDFAHTPHSLSQILPECKKLAKGKLFHVFGAAGERDISKRPLMGEASAKNADVIVLTAEDPRREKVEKTMEDIASGIKGRKEKTENSNGKWSVSIQRSEKIENGKSLIMISNRQEAINFAISLAEKGDVVVITGKGHEQSMNLGSGEEPWSEHKAVEKALKLRSGL